MQSVFDKTKGIEFEVIVVDNASSIGEPETFLKNFPSIKLVKSPVNLGFAGGNNLGMQYAIGEKLLLLNSDTMLLNNAVKLCSDFLDDTPKAGVVSAQLQYPDGRIQSVSQRFPSVKYALVELFRFQKLLSKKRRGELLLGAFFDHQTTVRVDWVWGAFFMFRREILNLLPNEQLDQDFFMYAEDMKWCFDIKKLGYGVYYYPLAKVIHFMGGSSGKKNELMEKNNQIFLERNYNAWHRWLLRTINRMLQ